MVLCAHSKCPDVGLLQKQANDAYQVVEIEDYRCNIPLSSEDQDQFPIGFDTNFNCQNTIEFENYGDQPASPLTLILTDTGFLCGFYVINLDSKKKSICYAPKKLTYNPKAAAPSLIPTFQPQNKEQSKLVLTAPNAAANKPTLQFNLPQVQQPLQPQPQLQSQLQPQIQQQQQQSISSSQSSVQLNFQASQGQLQTQIQSQLSVKPQFQPQMQAQPQFQAQSQQQLQIQQQMAQQILFQAAQASVQQYQTNVQPSPAQTFTPPKQHHQLQQSKPQFKTDLNQKLAEFSGEFDAFKANVNKLFKGKDLSKSLLNLSIIKKTKAIESEYIKINNEFKVSCN